MHIWVDADACPKVIKEILYRAVKRTQTKMTLVTNQNIWFPKSPYIRLLLVDSGFDVADHRIVAELASGDLVITADIILADAALQKGGQVLNPRGTLYTVENIKSRLSTRNLMESLRDSGVITGGPAALNKQDIHVFSCQLDKLLAQ